MLTENPYISLLTSDLPLLRFMNVLYKMTTSSLVSGFAIARQFALTPSLENFCYLINNTAFGILPTHDRTWIGDEILSEKPIIFTQTILKE